MHLLNNIQFSVAQLAAQLWNCGLKRVIRAAVFPASISFIFISPRDWLVKMSEGAEELHESFKARVKEEAETLVLELFPQRVVAFDEVLKSSYFTDPAPENLETCTVPNEDSSIPSNKHITQMVDTLKPMVSRLMEETSQVRIWITLLIPKIEDGNNFGVSIQEEALLEIKLVEAQAAEFISHVPEYFTNRGKALSKTVKYPQIQDYRRLVKQLDENEYYYLRTVLMELRNHYAILHDIITKNLDKIRAPRPSIMNMMNL